MEVLPVEQWDALDVQQWLISTGHEAAAAFFDGVEGASLLSLSETEVAERVVDGTAGSVYAEIQNLPRLG